MGFVFLVKTCSFCFDQILTRRQKSFTTLIYILVRKGGMSNVMVVVNQGRKNADGLKRSQARFRVRRAQS